MLLTHYKRIALTCSVFFLFMFTLEAMAVEKSRADSKSSSALTKQKPATQKKKSITTRQGLSKSRGMAQNKKTQPDLGKLRTPDSKKRKFTTQQEGLGKSKAVTQKKALLPRKKAKTLTTRKKQEASKKKAVRGVMQNPAVKKRKFAAERKQRGLTKDLTSKSAKPTIGIPSARDLRRRELRAREKIPQIDKPGSVDKVNRNIPIPGIGNVGGGVQVDVRGGAGKKRDASDPTGVLGGSLGMGGASGLIKEGRGGVPGLGGATTNVIAEPGMTGRGLSNNISERSAGGGKTWYETVADETSEWLGGAGGVAAVAKSPLAPQIGAAAAGWVLGYKMAGKVVNKWIEYRTGKPAGEAGSILGEAYSNATVESKEETGARATEGRKAAEQRKAEKQRAEEQRKKEEAEKKKQEEERKKKEDEEKQEEGEDDENDGTEGDDDGGASEEDTTQDPMNEKFERPAWMPDIGITLSPDGSNSTPADPDTPTEPDEGARQQAVDKIKAKQGELVQFGSGGGSTGGNTAGSPPPAVPDTGLGPECLDGDAECRDLINQ